MQHKNQESRDIYISFFMFTTDMKPTDKEYQKIALAHMHALKEIGYSGFEFPLAPNFDKQYQALTEAYANLRRLMDENDLKDMRIATNAGNTRTFDPTSTFKQQREEALAYLKSRVDITAALNAKIMMGPIIFPYHVYPSTDFSAPIWSDALQDYLAPHYEIAQPVLEELGHYAAEKDVKLAIEPITHWETPAPNTLTQLIDFLKGVPCKQVGVCLDSAHETLDGAGPDIFKQQIQDLAAEGRLHYAQISPPDRGNVLNSWIPWHDLVEPLLEIHQGPIAVEIFNAIPVFQDSLRLSRRKFWIPGEDAESKLYPSAYTIAEQALEAVRKHVKPRLLGN